MLKDFPQCSEEKRRQEGAVLQSRFVNKGDGVRWEFAGKLEQGLG